MDADAFAAQAVGLHARLTRVVLAMCGDRVLAEDSAQEALVRAWQRVERGDDLRSLDAWANRVALNWCRSQLRHTGAEGRAVQRLERSVPSPPGSDTVESGLRAGTLADEVHRAVLALPERQREVIVLHYLLDMDVASIAALAERSEGAVKNALFHGRAALARQLGDDTTNGSDPS